MLDLRVNGGSGHIMDMLIIDIGDLEPQKGYFYGKEKRSRIRLGCVYI